MKNTLEKIRRNTRNLGLAGLIGAGSVFMNGCETPQDRMITGMLLGGLAPYSATPQAAQSANFIGGAMVSSANAELSRSQVNVNVNVNNSYPNIREARGVASIPVGIWVDGSNYGITNDRPEKCEITETNFFYIPEQKIAVMFYNDGGELHPKVKIEIEDLDKQITLKSIYSIIGPGECMGESRDEIDDIENVPIRSFLANFYIAMDGLENYKLIKSKPFRVKINKDGIIHTSKD